MKWKKSRHLIYISILAVLSLAPSWPWERQSKASEVEEPNPSMVSESSSVETSEATNVAQPTKIQKIYRNTPKPVKVYPIYGSQKTQAAPVSQVRDRDLRIAKVSNQIQDIIKLNRQIRLTHGDRLSEIQRITDQARIHDKILQDIKASKATPNTVDVHRNELVQQEKLLLIERQTAENRAIFQSLQDQAKTNG